jgi:hypothetical protein
MRSDLLVHDCVRSAMVQKHVTSMVWCLCGGYSSMSKIRQQLEAEVAELADEVARLRQLCEKCVNDASRPSLPDSASRDPPPPDSLPDMVGAMPSIFSGVEGTTRLFNLLVETYPWLQKGGRKTEKVKKKKKKSKPRTPTPSSSEDEGSESSEPESTSTESVPTPKTKKKTSKREAKPVHVDAQTLDSKVPNEKSAEASARAAVVISRPMQQALPTSESSGLPFSLNMRRPAAKRTSAALLNRLKGMQDDEEFEESVTRNASLARTSTTVRQPTAEDFEF